MEHFSCKTKIVSGPGALSALGKLGCLRLLVVSDPYFAKNGTAARVGALSQAEKVEIFDKVAPDPSVELVASGTALMRSFQPDTLVALGGGSAMDCAKAMAFFAGGEVRLVAVPTTSGSGSEVTDFAILTHGNIKHPLVDKRLQPDMAILDSELLQQLPASLIADAGFDVLSHALEALAAKGAGAFTDALAMDAFCTVFSLLKASFSGDRSVRLDIHNAAAMAGLAFSQAGLGLCHAMSHTLGGMFHIPHGRLNAILLPAVIACNAEKTAAKYGAVARRAGLGGSADLIAVRNLRNGLIRLRKELGLPATLRDAGISPQQVRQKTEEIIKAVLQDPCGDSNPVTVDSGVIRRVLQEVTGYV